MDMGIKGRKAIVCAASKGLGKGCAMALAHEGVDLVINARTKAELEATAEELGHIMHAHPTLSEAVMEAAESTHGMATSI